MTQAEVVDVAAGIVDQQVEAIVANHRTEIIERLDPAATGDAHRVKSAAFVALCAKHVLDLDMDQALDALTDGGDDAGVDALHIGSAADGEFSVVMFQGKYAKNLSGKGGFPANSIEKAVATLRFAFDPKKSLKSLRPQLTTRLVEIRSLIADGLIPDVTVVFCNNGRKWESNGETAIQRSGLVGSHVTFSHVNHETLVGLLRKKKAINAQVQLTGKVVVEDFDHRRVLLGRLGVSAVARLFDEHGDALLDRNIRRYLGMKDNRVNSGIHQTLADVARRGSFYFFNNGITGVCTKFTHNPLQEDGHVLRVEGLQIVNGGQTCKTIQQTVGADPVGDYRDATVLLRLYEVAGLDDPLVPQITHATNSQNPVDLVDLKSNDPVQDSLAMGLKVLGFEYKRKRDDAIAGPDTITVAVAAEAVMSVWRRKPHAAKFRRSKLFSDYYAEIFSESLQPAHVLLSVLVFRAVESERKRAAAQDRFVPYASHFLAMVVGDLLLEACAVEREQLSHVRVAAVRAYFEAHREQLYRNAVKRIAGALKKLGVSSQAPLPRIAAQFRRGDLLEPLAQELSSRAASARRRRTSKRRPLRR